MKKIALLLFILLSITLINAAPPVTQVQQFSEGYVIEPSPLQVVKQNTPYQMNFFIYNVSTGREISNTSTSCLFYLANSSGIVKTFSKVDYFNDGHWGILLDSKNFSTLGFHPYGIKCNSSMLGGAYVNYFQVTTTGQLLELKTVILVICLLIISIIIFLIGSTFKPEQFILRSSFYVISTLLILLAMNSTRIIVSESSDLNIMSTVGLTLSIVTFLFMLLYTLIYWTIQTFKSMKEKNAIRWNY